MEDRVIEFHLDSRSGVVPYLQLIHQVRHALRLGLLNKGDQLPKVKDVAAGLAINPNTVLKAYRELEYVGLVGPNGAGKTTLINLATGMLAPSAGTIEVLGGRPAAGPAQLARLGYLAQDAPLYAGLSVADHLRLAITLAVFAAVQFITPL